MKVLVDEKGFLPEKAHSDDAGFDLKSPAPFSIMPGMLSLINTHVHICPDKGSYGLITGRSSLSAKGILCFPGTVDAGYTGEIKIELLNMSGKEFHIDTKDKIAQYVPIQLADGEVEVVESFEETDRGDGGFGSTGK